MALSYASFIITTPDLSSGWVPLNRYGMIIIGELSVVYIFSFAGSGRLSRYNLCS
ncbi:MAG: hypothetical protein ACI9T9_000842 [Oleiphilaceae bacterium]|jgi:hypothetical protein